MSFEDDRDRMVDRLLSSGYLKDPRVAEAMRKVPRHLLIPTEARSQAYADHPLPIGEGQTISAPHMVAIMTDLLDVDMGSRILEVGTGSGYQAAILAELAPKGFIYTVERVGELAARTRERLKKLGYEDIQVIQSDGTLGYPAEAPYDRVIVTAAAPEIPPTLVEQIDRGGKMLIPVGGRWSQRLMEVFRDEEGDVGERDRGGCVFVPLIGEEGWKAR